MSQPTLTDVLSEIMDDLDRPDLEPQIRRAVSAAVRRYQPDRFGFNEGFATFLIIPGADVYGSGDAPAIPGFMAIDSAVLVDDDQTWPLKRIDEAQVEALDDPGSASRPVAYSLLAKTLRLWPIPSEVWTIRLMGHLSLDLPPGDDDPSPWFGEGRDLIMARAKWHLALNVLKDANLKGAMDVMVADAFETLRGRANVIASTGQIQAWDC